MAIVVSPYLCWIRFRIGEANRQCRRLKLERRKAMVSGKIWKKMFLQRRRLPHRLPRRLPRHNKMVEPETLSNRLGLVGLVCGEMLAFNGGNPVPSNPPSPNLPGKRGHPPLSPPPIPPLPKKN